MLFAQEPIAISGMEFYRLWGGIESIEDGRRGWRVLFLTRARLDATPVEAESFRTKWVDLLNVLPTRTQFRFRGGIHK